MSVRDVLFCFACNKQKNNNTLFRNDALTIYDGSTNTSPMIGKYCGDSLPSSEVSSTNKVFIHFKTDGSSTRQGFKLEYHPNSKHIHIASVKMSQLVPHDPKFPISPIFSLMSQCFSQVPRFFNHVSKFPLCPNISLMLRHLPHITTFPLRPNISLISL